MEMLADQSKGTLVLACIFFPHVLELSTYLHVMWHKVVKFWSVLFQASDGGKERGPIGEGGFLMCSTPNAVQCFRFAWDDGGAGEVVSIASFLALKELSCGEAFKRQ